jgi:alkylhydroperoxidase/carboxymuconolactone decarboxylase family protein YurZ
MNSDGQHANPAHALSPRDISILNVAVLVAQNRSGELRAEISRALLNGVNPDGIRAIVVEVASRVGGRAVDAIRVAKQTMADLER